MEDRDVTEMTADEIEYWLAGSELAIGGIRAMQMRLLQEADARQMPLGDGCRSTAEWAAGRMDISVKSARTLTSTACRLSQLPEIGRHAEARNLTYERTVEIARLATETTETETIEDAAALDIAGIQRQNARKRHLTRADERDIAANEHVVLRPNLDESRWDLWGTLSGYAGRIVDKALAARADELPTPPEGLRLGVGKRQADALVSISQDSLSGTDGQNESSTPLVSIFVDATDAAPTNGETGAFIDVGPRVGPDTLERVLCEGSVEVIARTSDGVPLTIGTAARAIPPKIRRFVLHRDGGCGAEGCDSTYRLQVHHRIPYPISRCHDPDILATFCWWHHQVVIHQLGYSIDPRSPIGRIRFIRPARSPGNDPPP